MINQRARRYKYLHRFIELRDAYSLRLCIRQWAWNSTIITRSRRPQYRAAFIRLRSNLSRENYQQAQQVYLLDYQADSYYTIPRESVSSITANKTIGKFNFSSIRDRLLLRRLSLVKLRRNYTFQSLLFFKTVINLEIFS